METDERGSTNKRKHRPT